MPRHSDHIRAGLVLATLAGLGYGLYRAVLWLLTY